MTDFADLGIRVQSADVLRAQGDLRSLTRTGADTERQVTRQTTRISAAWSRMGMAAGAALGLVASALGGRAVISTLAGFDSSMAQVQAITRATAADMERLRAVAMELGATTEFSASQAADGLRFLGMAGFTAAESMAAIPAVLDLATAASMGLSDAADITSNIMSGFGIAAADAASVADVLAAASSRANTDVAQLGSAMSTVAPISAALGISLSDTAAAIGLMSDAGIQGERAGTALRGVLASLAGPTTQAAEVLASLGLSIADVNPEAHSMEVIFGRLRAAGMSTADAMVIFGREAASGALVLAGASERLGEFGRELAGVGGEAARMAGIMRDTLQGDINTLKSAIEGLILAMGDAGLTAIIRAVVQALTFLVAGAAAAVVAFSDFGEVIGGFEGYLIAAALAVTTYFIPAMASSIPLIWGAVTATAAWVAALVTVRGALIATGIGAFVVAAGYAINLLLDLRRSTGSWGEALSLLGDVARGVWAGIVESAGAIPIGLGAVWYRVKATFAALLSDLSNMWADFLQSITSFELGGISTPFGDFNFGNLDLSPLLGDSVTSARNFAAGQLERSNSYGESASDYGAAAAARAAAGFDTAREALARLRETMAEAGGETTDTAEALAAINDALGETPSAAAGAAGGVAEVGDAATEAQSRMEAMAGNMSRFFMQIIRGGDAARNAISQLLDRAAEMLMNQAFMSLLGGFGGGKGGGGMFGSILGMLFNANGNVFSGSPSLSAYSGQVVSSPTMFAFANGGVPGGRMGVMGEAGPEAIMPLKRGRDGKLGVAASGGGQGGGGGVSRLELALSADLEARILQEAVGMSLQIMRGGLAQNRRTLPGQIDALNARGTIG